MDKKIQVTEFDMEQARLDQEISANKLAQQIMIEERGPLTTLYSWKAPERLFNPKSRIWYAGIAALAMLFIVYSALTANIVLIFMIIALVLVVFSMYSIKPHETTYRITSKGLNAFEALYTWRNISFFWVTKRGNNYLLNFDFKEKATDLYNQRMIILVGEGELKTIVNLLVRHVDYLTIKNRSIISNYLEGKYVPLLDIVKIEDITEAKEEKIVTNK